MTGAQPTSRRRTRWSCDHTNHVIANTMSVVSTEKQQQTRQTNTRATGVQKRPDRNRERGLTSPSNRGAAHKLTPRRSKSIKHMHMCTESSDNSERLQCRRAYRVLSASLTTGFAFVPLCVLPIKTCTHIICTTLHTTLPLVPQRQLDCVRHTRIHSQE